MKSQLLLFSLLFLFGSFIVHTEAGIILKTRYEGALNTGIKHRFGTSTNSNVGAADAPEQWFTQKLDHFDPQNRDTWKQLYFVNSTMYKPGGPVFFILGGEGRQY
jgi:hypothetical protein